MANHADEFAFVDVEIYILEDAKLFVSCSAAAGQHGKVLRDVIDSHGERTVRLVGRDVVFTILQN